MDTTIAKNRHSSEVRQLTKRRRLQFNQSRDKKDLQHKIFALCQPLIKRQGIYSTNTMKSAGFNYTGNGDTVHCDTCGLKVSNWTLDMQPFLIHAEREPTCSYVRSLRPTEQASAMSTTNLTESTSTYNSNDRSSELQTMEVNQENRPTYIFAELESLKKVRRRTFSHWPRRTSLLSTQMIEAGFFNCNVGDRVICLYCNIICQNWIPHTDDPREVHRTLSPKCSYVISYLKRPPTALIPTVNEASTRTNPLSSNAISCDEIVSTDVCHTAYTEIPKRYASFNTWSNENSPSVDDLVRAGFFYTGTKTIVTCFYCNGSLQNWSATDRPTIEHARWFPHCAYVKQLCGDAEYQKIQRSNQRLKEFQEKSRAGNESEPNIGNSSSGRLYIQDESTLSRYVAARLDLPVSQSMLNRNFKLSIVKRCWEDQLRLKGNDFSSDVDLFVACTILKKQIECIDGKKENIIIPSVAMNKIREKEQTASKPALLNLSNNTDVEMSSSITGETPSSSASSSLREESDMKSGSASNVAQTSAEHSSPLNPCALCLSEEKCLAFVPCGHVATCVSCGHSVRSCPICRTEIKAFVRVYL